MLDCIHAGATDYLLKPLYLNVIKTLFLVTIIDSISQKCHFDFFVFILEITPMSTRFKNARKRQ